jgi:hypothetical protein
MLSKACFRRVKPVKPLPLPINIHPALRPPAIARSALLFPALHILLTLCHAMRQPTLVVLQHFTFDIYNCC